MPKRPSFVAPTTAYPAVDPQALTTVEDALEALQTAFRARDETPRKEKANVANPQQASENETRQT
jgi:hypothetical protein